MLMTSIEQEREKEAKAEAPTQVTSSAPVALEEDGATRTDLISGDAKVPVPEAEPISSQGTGNSTEEPKEGGSAKEVALNGSNRMEVDG
jgi:hypothetical protein